MTPPTPSNPSLRSYIARNVLPRDLLNYEVRNTVADALLADPTLAAIIDLAANPFPYEYKLAHSSPEVRALLTDWRAER